MRRLLFLVASLLVVSTLARAHEAETEITLLHSNDPHGRYAPFEVAPGDATSQTGDPGREPSSFDRTGSIGGMSRLVAVANALRAQHGAGNVLLVGGGDTFSDDLLGNLTKGEAMIQLMNAAGYQFMALGNHDFDYGRARTQALQTLAQFPMRGANVLDENGKPFLGDPAKIFILGGIKVAVLGLGYHNTGETGNKKNFDGLRFISGIDAVRDLIPALRREADAIVVVSHQGSSVDRELAKKVNGIDIIIGAHSHDVISPPEKVGNTWLVQAMSDTAALGELNLRFDSKRRLKSVAGRMHMLWTDAVKPDPKIDALIEQLRAPHRARLEEVIATAPSRIGRQYRSESPFDTLVGNILRAHTGAEVGLMPGVGYGISLSPGPVTREMLYTLLPHPSKIVTMELSGAQLLKTLEQSATNQRPHDPLERVGGLIQTAGMRWTVDLTRSAGQRIRDVSINGEPLAPTRYYKVATHNGMSAGLHRYAELKAGRNSVTREETVTDVVEQAMRKAATVHAPPTGDVTLIMPPKGS